MTDTSERVGRFIVVGVDGSEPSLGALRWAAEQARLTGASLRVLMAWEISSSSGWAATFPIDYDPEATARHLLNDAITSTLGAAPVIAVEAIVKEGRAAPLLLAEAHGADLLVVGTHGHGAFAGLLLGSVPEHLLRHAPCAIVIVRCGEPGQ
ncbi:MAG: universal stress protein [Acidimicrobiales bacterium]|jgi:nucleotide-binding universal stress UspA family protein